jgi:hypothetical protein
MDHKQNKNIYSHQKPSFIIHSDLSIIPLIADSESSSAPLILNLGCCCNIQAIYGPGFKAVQINFPHNLKIAIHEITGGEPHQCNHLFIKKIVAVILGFLMWNF